MITYGTVDRAMREAIRIAFAVHCYSFVSKNRGSGDQYAFNCQTSNHTSHPRARNENQWRIITCDALLCH